MSGFWSLEEERELNFPLTFDLGWGEFTTLLGGICLYPSGAIRSVTLFPGETLRLPSPAGELLTGVGFSLHESGALASAEPASPLPVVTPVGNLEAFDPTAAGVNADRSSLRFDAPILGCQCGCIWVWNRSTILNRLAVASIS
jgi:hypothetical protein